MRVLTLALGTVLTLYSAAALILQLGWKSDPGKEAFLCRFRLCATDDLASRAEEAFAKGPEGLQESLAARRVVLSRNPHSPYAWADLAGSLLAAGREREAEFAIRQAQSLAPNWPIILLRVADFHYVRGRAGDALPVSARILDLTGAYDRYIFSHYLSAPISIRQILSDGIPPNPRPARAFLSYLIESGRSQDAVEMWNWIEQRNFADGATVNRYTAFLLGERRLDQALAVWSRHYAAHSDTYANTEFVFNGGFEMDFSGGPLDWTARPAEGVEIARDSSEHYRGNWALRVTFLKTHNVSSTGLYQTVILPPGSYRLQAWLRAESLTTDQGVFLRLRAIHPAPRGEVTTEPILGSLDWTPRAVNVRVGGPQPALYRLELSRSPSAKFDRLLGGTLWLDEVQIQRLPR